MIELLHGRSNGPDNLQSTRPGANHRDPLPHRVVGIIPSRRVQNLPLELVHVLDFGGVFRAVEEALAVDHDVGEVDCSASGFGVADVDFPFRGGFVVDEFGYGGVERDKGVDAVFPVCSRASINYLKEGRRTSSAKHTSKPSGSTQTPPGSKGSQRPSRWARIATSSCGLEAMHQDQRAG